jgi:two-component system, LuxR family, sensor kinase FixL
VQNKASFAWLPFVGIFVCCLILLLEMRPYLGETRGLVVVAAIAMAAFVALRQVVFTRENLSLQKEQAKRQSESKFKTLVENSSDILTIRDLQGKVIFRSPSVKNILGFEPEEMDEHSVFEFIHPDDLEILQESFRKLESGEINHFYAEYRHKHKDGSWRVMEGIAKRVDDDESQLHGIIVNSRDITKRKQDEERLRLFVDKLRSSNRELQDFAYVASHDLQEPLRKVQAFGDRLNKKYAEDLPEEGRDYIRRMSDAASRMQRLINDLLTFSRVTTKAEPFQTVSLTKIVAEVVSDLEVRIEETGAQVKIGELPEIDADPTQIRQLMQNLLGNALKFTQPGKTPYIEIFAEEFSDKGASFVLEGEKIQTRTGDNRMYQIWIKDNGIGFDEKYLDRIFTVFQRLHGRTEFEGSGVGLAVCRKIAERHHGSITAQSKEGEGSTFIVTLPVKQTQEEIMNERL